MASKGGKETAQVPLFQPFFSFLFLLLFCSFHGREYVARVLEFDEEEVLRESLLIIWRRGKGRVG